MPCWHFAHETVTFLKNDNADEFLIRDRRPGARLLIFDPNFQGRFVKRRGIRWRRTGRSRVAARAENLYGSGWVTEGGALDVWSAR